MNKKGIVEEIKTILFGKEQEVTEVVEKFLDAKSGDLILRVEADAFAPKLPLLIVTPDGVIPAEDGEYILEDGTVLEVKAGIIDEVSIKEEEEETSETQVVEDLALELPGVEEKVDETKGMTSSVVEEEIKPTMEDMEARIAKLESFIEELSKDTKTVAEFSKMVEEKLDTFVDGTPAEQEFKSIKAEYNAINDLKSKTESNLERIKNLRSK